MHSQDSAKPSQPALGDNLARRIGPIGMGLLVVALLAIPLFVKNQYIMHIFVITFWYGYLATAWGLVGQTGQLSWGHAVFVGLGGYTSSILFMDYGVTPWIGTFIGVVVAFVAGLVIGWPTLRLRGPYFALSTLAFSQILNTYVNNTDYLGPFYLRGAMGCVLPLVNGSDAPQVFQFATKAPYYYIALAMMVAAVALSYWINRRRMGFYWTAIRGDQDAAESLGIDAPRYRLIAWLISVALFAFAGTFYAQYVLYINAERCMGADLSLEIAAMGVIGGWQSVFGPVVGSALLAPVSEIIRARFGGGTGGVHLILYGLLLMIVILRMPDGLLVALGNTLQRRQRRARAPRPSEQGATEASIDTYIDESSGTE